MTYICTVLFFIHTFVSTKTNKYLNIMKTHKATKAEWRIKLMNRLSLSFEIKNNLIIYKADLKEKTFVSFLVDNSIDEDFK